MKEEIKVPPLGESISEATIVALLQPSGSMVKVDDEIIELATDKVNQVLYAPCSGVFEPNVKEEDVVKIGQVIGFVDKRAESVQEAEKRPQEEKKSDTNLEPTSEPVKKAVKEEQAREPAATGEGARRSIDQYLSGLEEKPASQAAKEAVPTAAKQLAIKNSEERESRRKLTKIRKIIASRLVEVQSTTAMLTTFNEVDLTEIMALREKYKDYFTKNYGARLGFMSFFVKAVVSALKAFPMVNAYIDGEDLVERHYYSIGIAVGSEKGLVVPVLKECDQLSFAEIELAIADFAQRIKEGKLSPDELQGGGFTITNGGVYGSMLSTPILSPKQCGILGMHKISKRPVVIDDQIVIRQMMYLALSYDHRIIDGKEAVSFLAHIKNALEDPRKMLLET